MPGEIVATELLSCSYREGRVLDDISFQVERVDKYRRNLGRSPCDALENDIKFLCLRLDLKVHGTVREPQRKRLEQSSRGESHVPFHLG